MSDSIIRGKLMEDGQTMNFPIIDNGKKIPYIKAMYNVYKNGSSKDYITCSNLFYLTLLPEMTLDLESEKINVDEMTLAKIHPNVPFRVAGKDGQSYHSFELLKTPKREYSEDTLKKKTEKYERVDKMKIVKNKGLLFPASCAFRIPGWLAKEFNGSPEFGFAYSPFSEAREEEKMHYHTQIIEPYIGIDGSGVLLVNDRGKSENIEIKKGDVVIPMPKVPHMLNFNKSKIPFTIYNINYFKKGLDEVNNNERTILQ